MPDLSHSLRKFGLGHLQIVAEKWGSSLSAPDARQGLVELVDLLLNGDLVQEGLQELTGDELSALDRLESLGGKEPWDQFTRRFGGVREVGAGRLERERPDLKPASPVESLWYRGLVARGFFETESGPLEFAYIPDDLRKVIMPLIYPEHSTKESIDLICRKASPKEKSFVVLAASSILDDICTLLAGIRMNQQPDIHLPGVTDDQIGFYRRLCRTAGLISAQEKAVPENIRVFFDLPRSEALSMLWKSWRDSTDHHDLELVPGLKIEGELSLASRKVRTRMISFLRSLDPAEWWSITSFLSQVKELYPDFQRSGGDYDAWFIKNLETGEFLRGFENWEAVEGALLRYLITGPMHWLGLIDLGYPEEEKGAASYRISSIGTILFEDAELELPFRSLDKVQVRAKGEIRMTENVPHKTRYQIARFCDWQAMKADAYYYSISPSSLKQAEEQGLRVAHFLALLKSNVESIPPNFISALERWEKGGVQASIAKSTILRVSSPRVLKALQKSKVSRFILEVLGPTVVTIQEGSEEKISEALIELGYFLDLDDHTGSQT